MALARSPVALGLSLVGVLLLAVAPFAKGLFYAPYGSDDIVLITEGSLRNPDWLQWVFLESHWIAYRPLSVISFVLTDALGGAIWMHNATQLVILCFFLVGVFVAYRAIEGGRGWTALLATALVALHPSLAAVGWLHANRSYPLAAGFGLFSVALLLDEDRWWSRWAAGLLAAMAVLSNETAYLFVLLGPFAVWIRTKEDRSWRELSARLVPYLALVPLAFAFRYRVLDGLGGYETTQVLDIGGKQTTLAAEPMRVLVAASSYLVAPIDSIAPRRTLPLGGPEVVVVWLWLLWCVVRAPRSAAGWGAAWAGLTVGLATATHIWYPRMALGMAVGIAFAAATGVRDVARAEGGSNRWWKVLPLVPLVGLLLVNGAFQARFRASPSVYGQTLGAFAEVADRVEHPATIFVGTREVGDVAMQVPRWLDFRRGREDERFELLLVASDAEGVHVLEEVRRIAVGQGVLAPNAKKHFDGRTVDLKALREPDRHNYYFWLEDGEPRLLALDSEAGEPSGDQAPEPPG